MQQRLPKPEWGQQNNAQRQPTPPARARMHRTQAVANFNRRFQHTYPTNPYEGVSAYNSCSYSGPYQQTFRQSANSRGSNRGRGRGRGRGHNNWNPRRIPEHHSGTPPNADGVIRGITKVGFSFKRNSTAQQNNKITRKDSNDQNPEGNESGKICGECRTSVANYKCPQCYMKYCSIVCYKFHKSGENCQPCPRKSEDKSNSSKFARDNGRPSKLEYSFPTVDTIKPEGLEKITTEPLCSKLTEMLKNTRLREKIMSLDSSENPKALIDSFANDKEFSCFKTFVIENLTSELFN